MWPSVPDTVAWRLLGYALPFLLALALYKEGSSKQSFLVQSATFDRCLDDKGSIEKRKALHGVQIFGLP